MDTGNAGPTGYSGWTCALCGMFVTGAVRTCLSVPGLASNPEPAGTIKGWRCINCGLWITDGFIHNCASQQPQFPSVWNPTSYDPLILAELQAIRALLEKLAGDEKKPACSVCGRLTGGCCTVMVRDESHI
jgi:hypothetical protein